VVHSVCETECERYVWIVVVINSAGLVVSCCSPSAWPDQVIMSGLIMNLSDNAEELIINTAATCIILKVRI
jgi:hypothetical protein